MNLSAENIAQELHRRSGQASASPILAIRAGAFEAQLPLLDCEDRYFVVDSPRRAGKTDCFTRKAMIAALKKPNAKVGILTLTVGISKSLYWSPLLLLAEGLGIEYEPNHSSLTLTLANGSTIQLAGLDNVASVGKLRGHGFTLILVDEAQNLTTENTEEFVMSVVTPALMDKRGQAGLGGTPDPWRRNDYFYQAAAGRDRKWKHFQWKVTDNPHVLAPQEFLNEMLATGGYTETDARYQAEFLGVWSQDQSKLLYQDYSEANLVDAPPLGWEQWDLTAGVDLGFNDHVSITLMAQHPTNEVTAISTWSEPKLVLEQIATQMRAMLAKHPSLNFVVDEAGLGKTIAMSLATTYALPIRAAIKQDKRIGIAMLNSDFRLRNLWIVRGTNQKLIEQLRALVWDDKHQRELEGQPCDSADSFLYGYRAFTVLNQPLQTTKPPNRWQVAADKTNPRPQIPQNDPKAFWEAKFRKEFQYKDD